ncbi:cation:proton antiporter [Ilumatobacter nonamiensis]|uniref:cation:proton antiporter n=1 Tax=Ilumatobacter nonamiensis TaxID=467093 RepID=UPI0003465EC6|nr:cation:proton antiporter [Ilumatobacter nonamiensis]
MLAAGSSEAAVAFLEIGAVALGLAILARIAGKIGITAVPLYLIAGLAFGEGGLAEIDVSSSFIEIAAEIGVLLLLFTLGLEYNEAELRNGLRTGVPPGVFDMVANASPGIILGLVLGWEPLAAVLLGGVTWISSSGIISKVLADLGRLANRETPAILNLLVIEDLAMAVYLPVVAALIVGGSVEDTSISVGVALATVVIILVAALRYGRRFTSFLGGGTDESLLLAVFGVTLLVAGVAQSLEVSGAIGAFLVGLALSGPVAERVERLMSPLQDLFAATFFLFFSFQIDPADLLDAAVPAIALAVVTMATKFATGWYAGSRIGAGPRGRIRVGTALMARGEFSIVIAALGVDLADGPELGALAAGYVLVTAIAGPVATRYADRIPLGRLVPLRTARGDASISAR